MDIITTALIIKRCKEILRNENLITNKLTKVTIEFVNDQGAKIWKIVDQTSIIRPKKAKVIIYPDGEPFIEWSGFKSETEILEILK